MPFGGSSKPQGSASDYDCLNVAEVARSPMKQSFNGSPIRFQPILVDLGRENARYRRETDRCLYIQNWGLMVITSVTRSKSMKPNRSLIRAARQDSTHILAAIQGNPAPPRHSIRARSTMAST
jgi:hypothetical protein